MSFTTQLFYSRHGVYAQSHNIITREETLEFKAFQRVNISLQSFGNVYPKMRIR
jgi:hypothetical protein